GTVEDALCPVPAGRPRTRCARVGVDDPRVAGPLRSRVLGGRSAPARGPSAVPFAADPLQTGHVDSAPPPDPDATDRGRGPPPRARTAEERADLGAAQGVQGRTARAQRTHAATRADRNGC